MLDIIVLTLFPTLMVAAAVLDTTTMKIPNWLVLSVLVGFTVMAIWLGFGPSRIAAHLAIFLLLLMIGIACFAQGWIGGGDAKLLAVMGLWAGPEQILALILVAAMAGGILTLGLLYFRSLCIPALLTSPGWLQRLHSPKEGVPYGIALAAGGLTIFTKTHIFLAAAAASS